jgi:hypothetical protein
MKPEARIDMNFVHFVLIRDEVACGCSTVPGLIESACFDMLGVIRDCSDPRNVQLDLHVY